MVKDGTHATVSCQGIAQVSLQKVYLLLVIAREFARNLGRG